jgi:GNAT superfamily N-acetyltransferase
MPSDSQSDTRDNPYTIRLAREEDLLQVAEMVDDFVKNHKAANHPRSIDDMRVAYFGPKPVAELIVAERDGRVVGMGQWVPVYDMFWSKFGGRGEWLYVRPRARGHGVWVAIMAKMCARIRETGGEWLCGPANEDTKRLYDRVTFGSGPTWEYHLSSEAFAQVADADGLSPREAVRRLPDPQLNFEPARPR